MKVSGAFRHMAEKTAGVAGSPVAFASVVMLTAVWLLMGPIFDFSVTWQLTMNTLASQVTFLIAFLLQNTQNRDTRTLQLKLDELLRAAEGAGARPQLIKLEELSDEDLSRLAEEFETLRARRRSSPPADSSAG